MLEASQFLTSCRNVLQNYIKYIMYYKATKIKMVNIGIMTDTEVNGIDLRFHK